MIPIASTDVVDISERLVHVLHHGIPLCVRVTIYVVCLLQRLDLLLQHADSLFIFFLIHTRVIFIYNNDFVLFEALKDSIKSYCLFANNAQEMNILSDMKQCFAVSANKDDSKMA